MINGIAMRLLASAAWGANFRLYSGAFLSIMDTVTDLAAIYRFWMMGQYVFVYANIVFIAASLLFQWILVWTMTLTLLSV